MLRIATLTALSLCFGAQALVPSTAAAEDDPGGCLRMKSWPIINVTKDCWGDGSGSGETIVVEDTKPDPDRPPSGPGFDGSAGRDSDSGSGPHRGGGRRGAIPKKKPEPKVRKTENPFPDARATVKWMELAIRREECTTIYKRIHRYWEAERQISRGEMGFWEWLIFGGSRTPIFEEHLQNWKRYNCAWLYQTEVF